MLASIARRIFGTPNDRTVARLQKKIDAINALEGEIQALDDAGLEAKTQEFRDRLESGEDIDKLLPEAFAVVREAALRVLGLRAYDVQMVGGMCLHEGRIAEMKTGEGKTLVATLPVYLNAISGRGVHVVTVNDYLAQRDAGWMGKVYRFLGMSVGCIVSGMDNNQRREAYAADITYGTNNEFGFDYLRDNMAFRLEEMVQRPFNFAIVDEVDSILIDEARTPLIISGATEGTSELYTTIEKIMPHLEEADYELDEKQRSVALTEEGQEKMEQLLGDAGLVSEGNLYDLQNMGVLHHLIQALRAHTLFQRDKEYVVKDGKVIIVDEFTGRMMEGRRFSEGLHQALEAKEGVPIQRENQTLASVTYQNYFRLYPKLAGMTGTALTEAGEFAEIYNLEVLEIPTNVPVAREDEDDQVFRTREEKMDAIVEAIRAAAERKQPVLVGTVSVEKSEELAARLKKDKIRHELLNARNHAREALIVAAAGEPGAVTIATNMAGRGTDIQLGGNLEVRIAQEAAPIEDEAKREKKIKEITEEVHARRAAVKEAGGLMVIGTERHESRRIDNQLRGRSGRQGDPGRSEFYLSLEDDLMRIFAGDKLDGMMRRLGLKEGEAIVHPWVNKALENAQKKVEARNFDIRKNLLKFDNVMNDQRTVIYDQRKELMTGDEVSETVTEFRHDVIADMVTAAIPENSYAEQWDIDGLKTRVLEMVGEDLPIEDWAAEEGIAEPEIEERIREDADRRYDEKIVQYASVVARGVFSHPMFGPTPLAQIPMSDWKPDGLQLEIEKLLGLGLPVADWCREEGMTPAVLEERLLAAHEEWVQSRETLDAPPAWHRIEKSLMLSVLDRLWKEHLQLLDQLRQGISLRAYAQRDPLREYQTEAFDMFQVLLDNVKRESTLTLCRVQPPATMGAATAQTPRQDPVRLRETRNDPALAGMTGNSPAAAAAGSAIGAGTITSRQAQAEIDPDDPSTWGRVPRNAPCPCGSGKKYKHCHGAMT